MTLASYLLSTFVALIATLTLLPNNNRNWWNILSEWGVQPNPDASYAKLPLMGVVPSFTLRPRHFVDGTGLHLTYRLEVDVIRDRRVVLLEGCWIVSEWHFGKDWFIDRWIFNRSQSQPHLQWPHNDKDLNLNIEVPSYSPLATPFTLTAKHPLTTNTTSLVFEISNLCPRYPLPSHTDHYIHINPPTLSLACDLNVRGAEDIIMRVMEGGDQWSVLTVKVPGARPIKLINYFTGIVIVTSLLYLLLVLYRA